MIVFRIIVWLVFIHSLVLALPQDNYHITASASLQQDSAKLTTTQLPTHSSTQDKQKKTKEDALALKDWLLIVISGVSALVAIAGLTFGFYQYKKRKEMQLTQLQATDEFKQKKKNIKSETTEDQFRQTLRSNVCDIQMAGPGLDNVAVDLDDAFVHLNISESYRTGEMPELGKEERAHGEHQDLSPGKVMERAFQKYNRKILLIVGDPGSGKTTLMKYYCKCCLDDNSYRKLGFKRSVLPFYFPLLNLDTQKKLAENIQIWAKEQGREIKKSTIQNWLDKRDCIVFLDGLDEINDIAGRRQACQWIDKMSTGFPQARFVVTTRFTGYREDDNIVIKTGHLRAEVRDFTREQKDEFLKKWFKAAHLQESTSRKHETAEDTHARRIREAERNAAAVMKYLEENKSLRELAGIPMLLQLIALIWRKHKARIKSRTKLYDVALDYLLEYRDEQRGLEPVLPAKLARRAIQPISLWMQEKLKSDNASREEIHKRLTPILETIDSSVTAKNFCVNLRDRAGIIADHGKMNYIFRHKSFREYFAGLQLTVDYAENNRLQTLVASFGESWWEEPLRYFISEADGKAFVAFMQAFFVSEKSAGLNAKQQNFLETLVREAPEKRPDAFIDCLSRPDANINQQRYALNCLRIIGGDRVFKYLHQYVGTGNGAQTDYAKEIIALLQKPIATIDKPQTEPHLFKKLPKSFRNAIEFNAEYILIKAGTLNFSVTKKIEQVPHVYFAKYPVTNKQYRHFIQYLRDESELNKRLQSDVFARQLLLFAKDIKDYQKYLGEDKQQWAQKLISKYDEDRNFNQDEQPVVGVSWFAARVYCFWLSCLEAYTEQENTNPSINDLAKRYRLPNEMEWQRAAAGRQEDGEQRIYPWPAETSKSYEKLANFGGKIGHTTPVGRYPEGATPEGLMDMAGNVWEWQENLYGNSNARAVRGGSWDFITVNLRCDHRDWLNPYDRNYNVGFRVVRPQS